jgi:hypothetical protein
MSNSLLTWNTNTKMTTTFFSCRWNWFRSCALPPQANKGNSSICHTERGLKVDILAVLADRRVGDWSNNPTAEKNLCLSFTYASSAGILEQPMGARS